MLICGLPFDQPGLLPAWIWKSFCRKFGSCESNGLELARTRLYWNWSVESNTEPLTTTRPRTEDMSKSELLFRDIKRLQSEGNGVKATARELGISRTTIRKYRAVDEFPQRARPTSLKRKVDPYKCHLLKRWKDGERNGSVLFKEKLGCKHSLTSW